MSHQTFNHEAMATTFQIFAAGHATEYLRQASAAAFRELERLESELSRFIESSDIGRANQLAEGESIVIGEDAMQCLLGAARISGLTNRAFDPAFRSKLAAGAPAGSAVFALDPSTHTLTSLAPRLDLDLGAVGKGFALDRMAETLREWDVASACLQSGNSTALALGPPDGEAGWPVGAGDGVYLIRDSAVSGSGIAVKGTHIVDPRAGRTAERSRRVWAFTESAADSDALSTAFFVMSNDDVAAFCREHGSCGAILTLPDGSHVFHGVIPAQGGLNREHGSNAPQEPGRP